MTTATLSIPGLPVHPSTRSRRARTVAAGRDVALSLLGNILLIGVAVTAALVVPVAAVIAFGPALLSVL